MNNAKRICLGRGEGKRMKGKKTILFLTPSMIGILVFYILPFFYLLYSSFTEGTIDNSFVGFQNYIELFKNKAFRTAIINTCTFSLIAVPLSIVIPIFFSLLLEENFAGKRWFRLMFLSPMMVPSASIVLIWQILFCYDGYWARVIEFFCGTKVDFFHSTLGMGVILLLFLWKNLGYYMIIYMAALAEVPTELLEAAQMDGGNKVQQFFYIKLPHIAPSILFTFMLTLIASFKIFREVYLLVGSYPYDSMYLLQHFINNAFVAMDYQKLSCVTIVLTILLSLVLGGLFLLENYIGKDFEA